MKIEISRFEETDIKSAIAVWNEVVTDGLAFPQEECLNAESGLAFFAEQSFVGVAKIVECVDDSTFKNSENFKTGDVVGLYILHPNNIGRCGHICNASYAVARGARGLGIGEKLVSHCIEKAKEIGFGILQFNAVVATNTPALNLYEKLGFTKLGVIPKGFKSVSGEFVDIVPHYIQL